MLQSLGVFNLLLPSWKQHCYKIWIAGTYMPRHSWNCFVHTSAHMCVCLPQGDKFITSHMKWKLVKYLVKQVIRSFSSIRRYIVIWKLPWILWIYRFGLNLEYLPKVDGSISYSFHFKRLLATLFTLVCFSYK